MTAVKKPSPTLPTSPLSRLDDALRLGLITPQQHALLTLPKPKAPTTTPSTPPPFYLHTVGGRDGLTPVPSDPYISGLLCAHPDDPTRFTYFLPLHLNNDPRTWKHSKAMDRTGKPITTPTGPLINTLLAESRIRESHLTFTVLDDRGRPHTVHLSAFGRLSAASISLDDSEERHLSSSAADRDSRVPRTSPSHPSHSTGGVDDTEVGVTLAALEAREAEELQHHRNNGGTTTPSLRGAGGSTIGHSLDLDLSDSNSPPFIPSLATNKKTSWTKGGLD